jgi:hypothetical protein
MQQKQRYRLAAGATSVIAATLVLILSGPGVLGWTLLVAGVLAIIAARPRD